MKHFLLSCILLWIAAPVYGQLSGDSFEDALDTGSAEITAKYLEENAFAYTEDGELQGIHYDIFTRFTRWAEQEYGIDVTINWEGEAESFNRFYNDVTEAEGGVFGLGTVTILEERREDVQFTTPYIVNIAVLVTHDSVEEAEEWDDLSGLTGITIPGTTLETRMEDLRQEHVPGLELMDVESQAEAMEQIDRNPELFTYVDLAVFWPLRDELQLRRHEFADEPGEEFGYVLPHGSDWHEPFERFMNLGSGFNATTTYRNIITEHLGEEVHELLRLARREM